MKLTRNVLVGLVIALFALAGCSSNNQPPPPAYEQMNYAQVCVDGNNNRAPEEYCDNPRPNYYPAWGSIYDDGYYVPSYGRPMTGWSRQRPRNYSPKTTIININGAGGTLNRAGSGTGVTTRSKLGAGGRIPTPPKGFTGTSGGRVDQAKAGGTTSTITRGGLGVSSPKSTGSKSSGKKGK